MSDFVADLTAITEILRARPLVRGSVGIQLSTYEWSDNRNFTLNLHETDQAMTAVLTDALGLTEVSSELVSNGEGGTYRRTMYAGRGPCSAHYGHHLTRQARRTASRADVLRATA